MAKSVISQQASVASIAKAMSVLRLLGASRLPLTMTEIARETGMTPSSCHDLVTTLVQLGFVQPSSVAKSYEIGSRFVRFAKQALYHAIRQPEDHGVVHREMNALSDRYNVHLSVMRPFGAGSYISTFTSEGSAPIRIRLPVGRVMPLFSGASGQIFAAYSQVAEADRARMIGEARIDADERAAFEECCREAIRRGWASNDGRPAEQIAAIAFPILAPDGHLLGALDAVMFRSHFLDAPLEDLVADSVEVCTLLGKILGNGTVG